MDSDSTFLDERAAFVPQDVEDSWKKLDGQLARFRRISRQVQRATELWDLRQLRQRLPELRQAVQEIEAAVEMAQTAFADWSPAGSAPEVAGYAEELERAAAQLRLTLKGTFPDYEVFPLAVQVDLRGEQVTIGRRKTQTLEPMALMREIQARHQALHRSSFNAKRFMQALVGAYDLLKAADKAGGMDVSLLAVHSLLTLRSGSGAYTKQEFAFDIYRLRRESDMVLDRRQISFLHGRGGNLTVPTSQGGTDLLNILRVVEVEPSD